MARDNIIAGEWATYAERILPADAGPVQTQEMKRAFFAGAGALIYKLLSLFEADREPTEEDLAMMDNVDRELKQFVEDVKAGRA